MDQKILEKITQVKDIQIGSLIPNTIDGVTIEVQDGRRQIHLPTTMDGERFLTWKKKRGGIFYKDVSSWLLGKVHGRYLEASGENTLLILRIIDEEDLQLFQLKRLVHGKIKDQNVMILKNLLENDSLEDESEYIKEISFEDTEETKETEDIEDPMIAEIINIPLEEDEANSSRSMSLFD
jgi:hypothetical protein